MSQVTKLLLKIVMDRMKRKIETELDDAQSRFRQGKGTREGLLNLRLICERHLGHSVSTQPIFAKVPRCPSPILPKKFLKLLWLV